MKELMIAGGVCAVLGLSALAGAGYALVGGKDVAIERIFGVIVGGLIGLSLLGAAQHLLRTGMSLGKPHADQTPADAEHSKAA